MNSIVPHEHEIFSEIVDLVIDDFVKDVIVPGTMADVKARIINSLPNAALRIAQKFCIIFVADPGYVADGDTYRLVFSCPPAGLIVRDLNMNDMIMRISNIYNGFGTWPRDKITDEDIAPVI